MGSVPVLNISCLCLDVGSSLLYAFFVALVDILHFLIHFIFVKIVLAFALCHTTFPTPPHHHIAPFPTPVVPYYLPTLLCCCMYCLPWWWVLNYTDPSVVLVPQPPSPCHTLRHALFVFVALPTFRLLDLPTALYGCRVAPATRAWTQFHLLSPARPTFGIFPPYPLPRALVAPARFSYVLLVIWFPTYFAAAHPLRWRVGAFSITFRPRCAFSGSAIPPPHHVLVFAGWTRRGALYTFSTVAVYLPLAFFRYHALPSRGCVA